MLTFAVTAFFALALSGALLTIITMFYSYRNKIKSVVIAGLTPNIEHVEVERNDAYRPVMVYQNSADLRRAFKARQIRPRPSLRQPAPVRAAA